MTTECIPAYLDFPMLGSRQVLADFDGGAISSDGGALLLRQVEALTGIVRQFAACFDDLTGWTIDVGGVQSHPCERLCGFSGASLPGTLVSWLLGKPLRL